MALRWTSTLAWSCLVTTWLIRDSVLAQPPQPARPVKVILHVHSTFSSGSLEVPQIVSLVTQTDADAVILTDSALRRWEYGVWPLRGLVKRVVEQPSVLSIGPERYLQEIQRLNDPGSPVSVLAGLEAAPFYYWQRSPFHRLGGELRGWNRHLLVFGLHDPKLIRALPVNRMDPYHGDQGARPYQQLIDFVVRQGGLVFWAHPEMGYQEQFGQVSAYTKAYPHLLEMTSGYHGFGISYLDKLSFVAPGGLWDRLLLEYCEARRAHPVWIIGELDWHDPSRAIDSVITSILAEDHSPRALLEALRYGRMWVFLGTGRPKRTTLVEVTVTDPASQRVQTMGAWLDASGPLRIRVSGTRAADMAEPTRVTLIRDGEAVDTQEVTESPFELEWTDEAPGQPGFYRAVIADPSGVIYTNPVFVQ